MSRTIIEGASEDGLFSIFENAQGLQRRVVRIISRGFLTADSLKEVEWQCRSIADDIDQMKALIQSDVEKPA